MGSRLSGQEDAEGAGVHGVVSGCLRGELSRGAGFQGPRSRAVRRARNHRESKDSALWGLPASSSCPGREGTLPSMRASVTPAAPGDPSSTEELTGGAGLAPILQEEGLIFPQAPHGTGAHTPGWPPAPGWAPLRHSGR